MSSANKPYAKERDMMDKTSMRDKEMRQDQLAVNKFAYSVEEVSKMTSLSKAFLRNEIRAENLKVKRCGRRVLILKDDFMNYLNGENEDEK